MDLAGGVSCCNKGKVLPRNSASVVLDLQLFDSSSFEPYCNIISSCIQRVVKELPQYRLRPFNNFSCCDP